MASTPTSPSEESHESSGSSKPSQKSGVREQDRYLPIVNVTQIMKKSLTGNAKISMEAEEAVQECIFEFIDLITSEANDKCQRGKRKRISGDDVFWAMTQLGFDPLRLYFARCRVSETRGPMSENGDRREEAGDLPGLNIESETRGPTSENGDRREEAGDLPGPNIESETREPTSENGDRREEAGDLPGPNIEVLYAAAASTPTSPSRGSHENGGGNAPSPHSGVRLQDHFLPIKNISWIMKKGLPANGKISTEAEEAVRACVSEFIAFITSEANDKCLREKRKKLNGDDLLWAMATLGFEDYVEPLRLYLARYREFQKDMRGSTKGGDGHRRDAAEPLSGPEIEILHPCPPGSVIYVDKYGNALVLFPMDTRP